MKRKEKRVWSWILIIFVLLIAFNFLGFLSFLNEPTNKLVAGYPNKKCSSDSDCILRGVTCAICDCGDAVNKNWYPFCPFEKKLMGSVVLCKTCPFPKYDFEIKCIKNQCKTVSKDDA